MKLNLEELKKIASAATPGPWKSAKENEYWVNHVVHSTFGDLSDDSDCYDLFEAPTLETCEHIAAFNPTVALALIERIEKLEGAAKEVLAQFHYHGASLDKLRSALEGNLSKFYVHGTDGCSSCETGRITLYSHCNQCIGCNPEAYKRKGDS